MSNSRRENPPLTRCALGPNTCMTARAYGLLFGATRDVGGFVGVGRELDVVVGIRLAVGSDGEELVGWAALLVVGAGRFIDRLVTNGVAPGIFEFGAGLQVWALPFLTQTRVLKIGLIDQ